MLSAWVRLLMPLLLLSYPLGLHASESAIEPNRTLLECLEPATAVDELANCTITARSLAGDPLPGANPADFQLVHDPKLLSPTPIFGGPVYWFVQFGTCTAGEHNVTVMYLGSNVTTTATVLPATVSNFSLQCSPALVTAGVEANCLIITRDLCNNPSDKLPADPSDEVGFRWETTLLGAALPARQARGVVRPNPNPIPDVLAGAQYTASFSTGAYYTEELNYTEYGVAGLGVWYGHVNFSESRESRIYVKAAALDAQACRVACEPARLLQWHTATCTLSTFDQFGNPQVGAQATDFAATYLANPGPLGT